MSELGDDSDAGSINGDPIDDLVDDLADLAIAPSPQVPEEPAYWYKVGQEEVVAFSATGAVVDDAPHPRRVLVGLLNAAERHIDVFMYTLTDSVLISALVRAHTRGVEVHVYVDFDQYYAKNRAGTEYGDMYRAINGLRSRIGDGAVHIACGAPWSSKTTGASGYGVFHLKSLLVDDSVRAIGSYNWTTAAYLNNVEDLYVVRGNAAAIRERLTRDAQRCVGYARDRPATLLAPAAAASTSREPTTTTTTPPYRRWYKKGQTRPTSVQWENY